MSAGLLGLADGGPAAIDRLVDGGGALLLRLAEGSAALLTFAARETALAALVFGVVWALTRALRRALARLHYALWSLVLVRLVLPLGLAAPWSARALIARWLGSLGTGGAPGLAAPTAPAGGGADLLAAPILNAAPATAGS